METILFKIEKRNDDGRISNYRKVTVKVDDENDLVFHCCDINKTAEEMFNDVGIEFYLQLNEENKTLLSKKLSNEFKLQELKNDEELLNLISEKFGNKDSCFEDIMDYLKEKQIEYQYSRW